MSLEIWMIIALTMLPFLELRASIPYGIINTDLHWSVVFFVAVVSNILLGPVVYLFIDKFVGLFLRIRVLDKIYTKVVERAQHRIHKAVEKWGELGVALFIGVPLPGSGSYSGAIGSYVIGLGFKRFVIANVIGVLIAGIAVTLVSLSSVEAFSIFMKTI